jgi:putative methionine-R-sulfoxide reductase with GAF domain
VRSTKAAAQNKNADKTDLFLPAYLNSSILLFVLALTILCAGILIPPALSETIPTQPNANLILVLLVCVAILCLISLFNAQRFVISSHERYEHSRSEVVQKAQRNADRLLALLEVSSSMSDTTNLQSVFDHITKNCGNVLDCHMVSLMVYDERTSELVVRSVGGPNARPEALGDRKKLGDGIAGWAAENRQPLLLSRGCDVGQFEGLKLKSQDVLAAMVVPIVVMDRLLGVLNVSTRSTLVNYDEADFKATQVFAANAGVSIRYAELLPHVSDNVAPLPKGDAPLPKGDAPLPKGDAPLPKGDAPLPKGDAPLPKGDAPLPKGDVKV